MRCLRDSFDSGLSFICRKPCTAHMLYLTGRRSTIHTKPEFLQLGTDPMTFDTRSCFGCSGLVLYQGPTDRKPRVGMFLSGLH